MKDLLKYPVYKYYVDTKSIFEVDKDDLHYNRLRVQAHHYIKQQDYKRNQQWYDLNGLKQKIFLLPIVMHEQLHYTAVKNMDEKQFLDYYGYDREYFLFNRRR
jgi:hypothetical protein